MWGLKDIAEGIMSGFVGPLFGWLNKKQDVTLEGFKTAGQIDVQAYQAALAHDIEINRLKLQAGQWWGARLLYMIVGLCACLHTGAVFIDSTLTFGSGHYGNLGVPKLPPDYFAFEQMIIGSLFVVSTVGQLPNAVAAWLHRK